MAVELRAVELSDIGIKGDLEKLISKAKILNSYDNIHVSTIFDTYMVEAETGLGIYDKDGKSKLFIDNATIANIILKLDSTYTAINSCYIIDFNKEEVYKYNLTFGLIESTISLKSVHIFLSDSFNNSKSANISFEEPELTDIKMIDNTMYEFESNIEDSRMFSPSKNQGIKELTLGTKVSDIKQIIEKIETHNKENESLVLGKQINIGNAYIIQIGDETLKISLSSFSYTSKSRNKAYKTYLRACGQGMKLINGKYSLSYLPEMKFNLSMTQLQLALYNRIDNKLYIISSTQWDNKLAPGENFNITYKTSNYAMIIETKLINEINNEMFISRIIIGDGYMYAVEKKEHAIPTIDFSYDKRIEAINNKELGLEYRLSDKSAVTYTHGKWLF